MARPDGVTDEPEVNATSAEEVDSSSLPADLPDDEVVPRLAAQLYAFGCEHLGFEVGAQGSRRAVCDLLGEQETRFSEILHGKNRSWKRLLGWLEAWNGPGVGHVEEGEGEPVLRPTLLLVTDGASATIIKRRE